MPPLQIQEPCAHHSGIEQILKSMLHSLENLEKGINGDGPKAPGIKTIVDRLNQEQKHQQEHRKKWDARTWNFLITLAAGLVLLAAKVFWV